MTSPEIPRNLWQLHGFVISAGNCINSSEKHRFSEDLNRLTAPGASSYRTACSSPSIPLLLIRCIPSVGQHSNWSTNDPLTTERFFLYAKADWRYINSLANLRTRPLPMANDWLRGAPLHPGLRIIHTQRRPRKNGKSTRPNSLASGHLEHSGNMRLCSESFLFRCHYFITSLWRHRWMYDFQ